MRRYFARLYADVMRQPVDARPWLLAQFWAAWGRMERSGSKNAVVRRKAPKKPRAIHGDSARAKKKPGKP